MKWFRNADLAFLLGKRFLHGSFFVRNGKTFLSAELAFSPGSGFTVQIFRFYWNAFLLGSGFAMQIWRSYWENVFFTVLFSSATGKRF